MEKQYFTKDNIWSGGFYELAIEVGIHAEEQMLAMIQAICSYPKFEGYYIDQTKEPSEQHKLLSSQIRIEEGVHLYGLALMPNGCKIVCGVCIVREVSGLDWVDFYIPMGSLGEVYDVRGYPFNDEESSEHWQKPVDDWFVEMGTHIFSTVPYQLGLIGHEVSGVTYSQKIAINGIPELRYIGYLYPSGSEIHYYPRNEPNSGLGKEKSHLSLNIFSRIINKIICLYLHNPLD